MGQRKLQCGGFERNSMPGANLLDAPNLLKEFGEGSA